MKLVKQCPAIALFGLSKQFDRNRTFMCYKLRGKRMQLLLFI